MFSPSQPATDRGSRPVNALNVVVVSAITDWSEMADLPPASQAVAQQGLSGQRTILRQILRDAVANGELAPGSDIDGLSSHFLDVLQASMNLPQAWRHVWRTPPSRRPRHVGMAVDGRC
jgi:hypothetical protein